ncbi:hypothetical protein GWK41_00930 [Persephonella atlantica]|uniref:Tfp pilus assembly protein PilO n=1 Tax=Persephonella atlantica TaxID=2699429 RepID=A0ABS1GFG2_9AQUI|nr:hypothetical protein [Persephonella atlantica]MBK3331625.1 hypothetical protein [Persephonella atlantica]
MIDKKYVMYLFAVVFSVLMLEVYGSFSELNQNMRDKKDQLHLALLDLKKKKKDIVKLKEEVSRLEIRPLSREEALEKILESTEYFVKMYDARITQPLSEKGNTYTITVSFEYYPESSEELIQFLNKLYNQISPQIVIKRFRLDNMKEGTKTYFEITLKQPFEGQV